MSKLKPCPFCGGEATIFQLSHSDSGGYDHPCEVGCAKCGIVMKRRFKTDDLYHGYPTNEEHEQVNCETIKAWNTRADRKAEPLTKCDLCKREGNDICLDCERKKQSGKE